MKKVFGSIVVSMLLLLFSLPCFAETYGDFSYVVSSENEDEIIITSYSGSAENVVIPETIDGKNVVEIRYDYGGGNSVVTSLSLPKTIKEINVVSIAELSTITIDAENPNFCVVDGIVYSKDKKTLYYCPQNFQGEIKILDGVTEIAESAFGYCQNLTSLTLPSSVKIISAGAFSDCSNLTSITLNEGLETIKDVSFYSNEALQSLKIPASVTSIDSNFTMNCFNLSDITVAEGNITYDSVDSVLFNKNKTTLLVYPSGKTATSYEIPSGVTTIDGYAFQEPTALKTIALPASLTSLEGNRGDFVFGECSALTTVTIDENNDGFSVQDGVLYKKTEAALTEILWISPLKTDTCTIPSTVKSINQKLFRECKNISGFAVEEGNTTFAVYNKALVNKTFNGYANVLLWVPKNVTGAYEIAPEIDGMDLYGFRYCSKITSISIPANLRWMNGGGDEVFRGCDSLLSFEVASANTVYIAKDGALYKKNGDGGLVCYPSAKEGALVLPDGMPLPYIALVNCTGLTELTIESANTYFDGSILSGCKNLKKINFLPTNTSYLSDDGIVFNKNKSKLIGYPQGRTEESYTVPQSVLKIMEGAVSETQHLKTVVLQDGVKFIGKEAFYNSKSITSLTIPKSVIYINKKAFYGCDNLKIYCYSNSTAEAFAKANKIPYVLLDAVVSGVTLNKTSLDLQKGESEKLQATVLPENVGNKGVTWSSASPKIAAVSDDGTVTAKEGGITKITVTTVDGKKVASCKVAVHVPSQKFSDVADDKWYKNYVYELASLGILNGKGANIFAPEDLISRGEFVKILAVASGDDLARYEAMDLFADSAKHWSKTNINWAKENKIVKGVSATEFAPDASITREEMAVMIYNYAVYKSIVLPEKVGEKTFADDGKIHDWAKVQVYAMQKSGIINGVGNDAFAPLDNAKRGEAAKMISLLLALY